MQNDKGMEGRRVLLGHGGGGRLTWELIRDVVLPHLKNPVLTELQDSAVLLMDSTLSGAEPEKMRLALTTDSYVVTPPFFPGGDIGRLAVCGTVNDLAVVGADPKALSSALIIEEGFGMDRLGDIVKSMEAACEEAGVSVVTGDTKVVEKGGADGIFITTAGIGILRPGMNLREENIRPGDSIVVSGSLGDHEIAVLSGREGFEFLSSVTSDCAPLNGMIGSVLDSVPGIRFMRDLTRGGLASVLNEVTLRSGLGILLDESKIPVHDNVRGACEILGYDPLSLANEGKIAIIAERNDAGAVLGTLRAHPYGRDAGVIGEVIGKPNRVLLATRVGGTRIIDMPLADQLPRIC